MSYRYCSALRGHPLPVLANNRTRKVSAGCRIKIKGPASVFRNTVGFRGIFTSNFALTLQRACETDHVSIGLLAHKSAERDDWRNACEEEKDGGSETLHVDAVLQHTGVHPRIVTVLHVINHTSEKPAIILQ